MTGVWERRAAGRWRAEPGTNDIDTGSPFYDVYEARDGRYLARGQHRVPSSARLLETLELDSEMASRRWDRSTWVADKAIAALRRARPGQWAKAFEDVDACVTPVNTLGEVTADPAHPRSGLIEVDGNLRPAPAPPRLSCTPARQPSRPALDRDQAEAL